jgi:hypothetical protein
LPANSRSRPNREFKPPQSGIKSAEPGITGKKFRASFDDRAPKQK